MKTLAALLIALAFPLAAQTPTGALHAECVRQMALGSCPALEPVESYTDAQLEQPVLLIGIGRVTLRDYLAVRGLGSVDPTDTRMCDVARTACEADWNSAQCKVGRSLWHR